MKPILLTTLNARYTHASIGLRYLFANMEELQEQTRIVEFVINEPISAIAEKILEHDPCIVGIGVYIWNAADVERLIAVLKKVSPETMIVLGGPEASHRPFRVDLSPADYIVQGEADMAFRDLCRQLLSGAGPQERMIRASLPQIGSIRLPYAFYSDDDIAHRTIYVEASRGCPFECEFCLSAVDEKVRPFDIDALLAEFEILWERGVRSFKFIDRTFNLNMRVANRLLDFFLAKKPPYFAHFEVIPDHFPESLREKIGAFPAGSLQLEIGIQTLNPDVAATIRRNLKIDKIKENIRFLETETKAHMHLDLIVGLPGETLESFGENLDTLCALTRSEIQIGILKKLSGTTLSRHDATFGMVYSEVPPYEVLATGAVSFFQIQRMKRFARFWDLCYNSGNFARTVRMLWEDGKVYAGFGAFAEWMYGRTLSTWKISLERLAALMFEYLTAVCKLPASVVGEAMASDLAHGRVLPPFLRPYAPQEKPDKAPDALGKRQARRMKP